MPISRVIAQLRTTDLNESIRFYTEKIGLALEFQYEDFYAGIRAGTQLFHLYFGTDDIAALAETLQKRGIRLVKDVHATPWGTKELVIKDNQGHTLYFGQSP